MKTITNQKDLLDDVKNLIAYSISNKHEKPDFNIMHRAIIKKYFEAKNVKINYSKQTVDMQIPVGKKQYTSITFECQNIKRFLKACLRKDEKSLKLYEEILKHYSDITHAA